MSATVQQLVAEANALVPRIDAAEARRLIAEEDALLLDVREPPELATEGALSGALNVPRGMVEFHAQEGLPSHDPAFRKDRPIVLYCKSGGRSALAGKALKDLGFERVANLGGFADAAAAGFPVERG